MRIDVPFDPEHNALDKKRQKRAPKVYKSGVPGPTGRDRLLRRVQKLELDLHKFARKQAVRAGGGPDADWATALAKAIHEAK